MLGNVVFTLIALVVICGIWYEASIKKVRIGLAKGMDRSQRHGVAWVRSGEGIDNISFTVDHPEYLENPSIRTIRDMFHQLEKLDYVPRFLEITVGDRIRVFENGVSRPIADQPHYGV